MEFKVIMNHLEPVESKGEVYNFNSGEGFITHPERVELAEVIYFSKFFQKRRKKTLGGA